MNAAVEMALSANGLPADVELEDVACPLGCSAGDVPVVVGRDRLHGLPGEFRVVKCRGCGLMRTTPRPTAATVGYYYPDDYGPYQNTVVDAAAAEGIAARIARRIIRFNNECLPAEPPGRLLEIGCASGRFLHKAAAQGWDVEGIEFSEAAAAAARRLGFTVHAGPLETAPDCGPRFDVIAGWMVLEHLHDPVGELRRIAEWARPGGWLALSVPNAGSLERAVFKDAWYAWQLPTHLFHYTPDTLARALASGGWKMEKLFHQRMLGNLFYSAAYRVADRRPYSRLARTLAALPDASLKFNLAMYPAGVALAALGQTGRITVWARRA